MDRLSRAAYLQGLYLILDQSMALPCPLAEVLQRASAAGVQIVQYRNKLGAMSDAYEQTVSLRDVAGKAGVMFIVNDRCDLARAVEADGVHLGQTDLPLEMARELVGQDCLIGISTHRKEEVVEATMAGADYLGFGPIFPTTTKNDHEPLVGLEGLRAIRDLTSLPLFAIGGITVQSVHAVIAAGADGVAVASAICDASDIQQTVQEFISAFGSASRLG